MMVQNLPREIAYRSSERRSGPGECMDLSMVGSEISKSSRNCKCITGYGNLNRVRVGGIILLLISIFKS